MTPAEALHDSVGAFVAALAASGIRHVSACPGSRSTPLAIEVARRPDVKLWMHLDERSAAYFGLGLAKALRQPVALLGTSGTAVANFLPAVVEANLARVPLVVLTGDRPHELRDNGAAQTMDQLRLYGSHAKWFFDLAEPDGSSQQRQLVQSIAARAVATASAEPAGPVHVNWPFREPLVPATHPRIEADPVRAHNPRHAPSDATVAELARMLSDAPRGLIVVGPEDADAAETEAIARLAGKLQYPVLADALSGVRYGAHDRSLVIDAYDAFLRSPAASAPEVVLRFGAIPTSKPLLQFLDAQPTAHSIVVDPGGWREPTNAVSDVVHADPELLCAALTASLTPRSQGGDWARQWLDLNGRAREAMHAHLATVDDLSEGKVFSVLGDVLPDNALLYAGNSMPVRDMDTFLASSERALRCLSNRGANGIDGVVSSALGASAAGQGPVVLAIGDISFYHDLNGLLAARRCGLDLLVVLLNNNGGGIFSFLPQADSVPEQFELLFGTPHGLDFRPFVEGYGGDFVRVCDWAGFSSAVSRGLQRGGLQVIEVPTERQQNVAQHRDVWRAVAEALSRVAVA